MSGPTSDPVGGPVGGPVGAAAEGTAGVPAPGPVRGPLAIGVDIGGTKVAAGLVDAEGGVLATARRPTPGRDPRQVEDTIVAVVEELAATARALVEERGSTAASGGGPVDGPVGGPAAGPGGDPVVAVGIGAAGFVSNDGAVVVFSPHLAWRDEPLRDRVAARLQRPVLVDNDANGAAWGEWRFGAGRGQSHLVCITLGTGIGGAVVVRGELERGRHGMAGEFGHMVVVPGGARCECGGRGCWEQYASGNVVGREGRELARSGSPVAHELLRLAGGDPEAVDGPLVTAAARRGDLAAREVLEEVGTWLGLGLANLAAALDPGAFVIGGGLSEAGDLFLAPARVALGRSLTGHGYRPDPQVLAAQLGPQAGLVGMADLARRAQLAGQLPPPPAARP